MDEKLREILDKVVLLSQEKSEFNTALQKKLKMASFATSAFNDNAIADDVKFIREALKLKGDISISYGFVKDERTKDQLIIDNLRMENMALDVKMEDKERFDKFCVSAFFQIENIINYFFDFIFQKDSHKISDCLKMATKDEKYPFDELKHSPTIFYKIKAICNILLPKDKDYTYENLRMIRNNMLHRGTSQPLEENNMGNFYKYNSFDTIRKKLKKLVDVIRLEMENPETAKIRIVEAEITKKLPGGCFISYNGQIKPLPYKFMNNVKEKNKGDKIKLTLLCDEVMAVE